MKLRNIVISMAAMAMCCGGVKAQDTPLMGWSSWNTFALRISDKIIMGQADAMVESGLKAAGYNYLNIDDGYFGGRDEEGNLLIHPDRFPNGMRPVVDYIHSKGLKAGIYTDAGHNTCGSYFGGDSIGRGVGINKHDQMDCDLWFKDLGFDFIKIDFCGGSWYHNASHLVLSERERYTDIARAIRNTGRKDVRMNVCRWDYPGTWVGEVAGSWRTTGDINCSWGSVKDILRQNLYLSAYASKGHYNDMDMLEVGRGLSKEEDRTHFGMWCIMNSPLLVGCDMSRMSDEAQSLMTNRELIALNQDPLCQQAYLAGKTSECYILVKDLMKAYGKERAVAIYNPTDKEQHPVVDVRMLDLGPKCTARDLYNHVDATQLISADGKLTVTIPAHGTRIYKLKSNVRMDRVRYEAETAYIDAYQELKNNQSEETGIYSYDNACSGGLKASWLGRSERNALQFRNVHVSKAGRYRLTIGYLCGEDRNIVLRVNGKRVNRFTVNSGGFDKVGQLDVEVNLVKGDNNITLSNVTDWMPDIDYIDVRSL